MDGLRPLDAALRRIHLQDFVTHCSIGVHSHEHEAPQRVRINLALDVALPDRIEDRLADVVDYDTILRRIRAVLADGHVRLVEILADRIADACLDEPRVRRLRLRIDKLDVYADLASVGVEIDRENSTAFWVDKR